MEFFLPKRQKFLLVSDKVPAHLARLAMPFSQCSYRLFAKGEVLTQLILGADYSIWLHHFIISERLVLLGRSGSSVPALCYMLEGSVRYRLKGQREMTLEKGLYQLLYIPGAVSHRADLPPGTTVCFHIDFHLSHLVPVAQQYPFFRQILAKVENNFRSGSSQQQSVIAPHIDTLIREIIDCDMGLGERTLFIESRIRDLLRLYARDQGERAAVEVTHAQLKLLSAIERYIVGHLDEDLTVRKLASVSNVSRSWLQRICKKHYGKALHELVTDKRMSETAQLLLTTNMPVNDIVSKVSNMNFPAFSAAFRKYFGQTPSAFRKNRGRTKQK